jgi:hypothetical protein
VDVGFEIAKGFRMTLIFGLKLSVGKFDDTHSDAPQFAVRASVAISAGEIVSRMAR